jgi:predicted esterase
LLLTLFFFQSDPESLSFNAHDDATISPGFDHSLQVIEQAEVERGPFDGILGFSQGASMVGLFLAAKKSATSFKFVIFVASFRSKSSTHDHLYGEKIEIPSLHVFGDTDAVISKQMSVDFLQYFSDPQTLNHSGGHFVPAAGPHKSIFNAFLDAMLCRLRQ